MRPRLVLAVALVALSALAAATPGAPQLRSTHPTARLTLAYLGHSTGSYNPLQGIYLVNGDGSGTRRLPGTRDAGYFDWSPDGSRIVFDTGAPHQPSDIWIISADGTGLMRLTPLTRHQDVCCPRWGAGGRQIVYESGNSKWLMNADGSDPRRVPHPGPVDGWSPDRTKIAGVTDDIARPQIYVTDANGTHRKQLTHNRVDWDVTYSAPGWSPDSKTLAFVSNSGGPSEITLIGADGSRERSIWHGQRVSFDSPSWSPDGRLIAFDKERPWDVFVIRPDGRGERRLTRNAEPQFAAWRPQPH